MAARAEAEDSLSKLEDLLDSQESLLLRCRSQDKKLQECERAKDKLRIKYQNVKRGL
jgi:hypothetical protein